MPIQIQQGRTLARLLEQFGIKGRHLLQLDEVIVPVAIVADLEGEGPDDEELCTAHVHVPPTVGSPSAAVLFNGTTEPSNWLFTVDWIQIGLTAAATTAVNFEVVQTSNAPIAPVVGSDLQKSFDDQRRENDVPPGELFADSGAFVGPSVARVAIDPAAGPRTYRIPLSQTLPSFRALAIKSSGNNVRLNATFHYRIRAAG